MADVKTATPTNLGSDLGGGVPPPDHTLVPSGGGGSPPPEKPTSPNNSVWTRLKHRAALWTLGAVATSLPAASDLVNNSPLASAPWLALVSGILFVTVGGFIDVVVFKKKGLKNPFQQAISSFLGGFAGICFVLVSLVGNYAAKAPDAWIVRNLGWSLVAYVLIALLGETWLSWHDKE